jgi:predicted CopG family antitoxin
MKQMQISLDEELFSLLSEESERTGKTVSEIMVEKLRKVFKEESVREEKLLRVLDRAFGTWKDKQIDVETFVRELRRGERIDSYRY